MGMACVLASGTIAGELPFDLGTFGEIPAWLIIKAPVKEPRMAMEKDPLESMGGEAKYAAMEDRKLFPICGNPLEITDAKGVKARLGEGVWEALKMAPAEMPGVFQEYMRLTVPQGCLYAYCRLDSPSDMKANLLTGFRQNGSKARYYLNGKDLGTFDGGHGFENKRLVPIELKKGGNHLLVRFSEGTIFACRLVGKCGEPLKDVKDVIHAPNFDAVKPPPPAQVPENQKLANLAKNIPPLLPPENPDALGMKLARTMALLKSGKYTNRPVRIIFSGQSIEAGWTGMFIQNLRERYPDTKIIAENRALGGCFVPQMHKLLKHDILRWQPDLILFSAYQGTSEVWERFLCELRSETTADIIIRTQHIGGWEKMEDPEENAETLTLRMLAQKYDVEFVEARKEWRAYLKANNMQIKDLLRDNVHINEKGDTFMALLYDRHMKYNPAAEGWASKVRRFSVGRFFVENMKDEIVLEGKGWSCQQERVAVSSSAEDRLKLKFYGNRVDLVFPGIHGKCQVLIDGKKPSELNLFHGTRPWGCTIGDLDVKPPVNNPWTYHTGKNMQEESWMLTITEANEDADPKKAGMYVKFSLKGSKTGFDGEGQNDKDFVSNSGRITILRTDWGREAPLTKEGDPKPVMKAVERPIQYLWHILPDFVEIVPEGTIWAGDKDYYYAQQVEYVTVADGLPCGDHELTLIPVPGANLDHAFRISGVEVYRPPLARDASKWTTAPR